MTVSERKGRERAPNNHRARDTPKQLRIDRKRMNRERRSEEAGTVGRRAKRGCPASLAPVHRAVSGCGSGRGPGGAGRARPNSGRGRARTRGPGSPDLRRREEGQREPGRQTGSSVPPYSHSSSSSPPVPLLSSTRRSTSPADMAAPRTS